MTERSEDASTKTTTKAVAAAAATLAAKGRAVGAEAEDKFLAGIRSDDEAANYAAWSTADEVDASVIPALSELLNSKKPNVRKAADEALKRIVHSVGKTIDTRSMGANAGRPDDPGQMDPRQQVVTYLRSILEGKRPTNEKTNALRHLSLLATSDDVREVAALIHDRDLREEAAFCLERIPGKASEEALLSALPSAADDFKPRILAALGHRRADEAVGVCVEAMGSEDTTIAMAGMKAWARIGTSTGADIDFPERDALTEWQQTEFDDSLLRFADAQLEKGNHRRGCPDLPQESGPRRRAPPVRGYRRSRQHRQRPCGGGDLPQAEQRGQHRHADGAAGLGEDGRSGTAEPGPRSRPALRCRDPPPIGCRCGSSTLSGLRVPASQITPRDWINAARHQLAGRMRWSGNLAPEQPLARKDPAVAYIPRRLGAISWGGGVREMMHCRVVSQQQLRCSQESLPWRTRRVRKPPMRYGQGTSRRKLGSETWSTSGTGREHTPGSEPMALASVRRPARRSQLSIRTLVAARASSGRISRLAARPARPFGAT